MAYLASYMERMHGICAWFKCVFSCLACFDHTNRDHNHWCACLGVIKLAMYFNALHMCMRRDERRANICCCRLKRMFGSLEME